MYFMLFYDYVPDVLDKRGPHRPAHLELLNRLHGEGKLVLAGAWNSPVDGAAFLFKSNEPSVLEEFVREDPYVSHGLVTRWRIREWNIVVGG